MFKTFKRLPCAPGLRTRPASCRGSYPLSFAVHFCCLPLARLSPATPFLAHSHLRAFALAGCSLPHPCGLLTYHPPPSGRPVLTPGVRNIVSSYICTPWPPFCTVFLHRHLSCFKWHHHLPYYKLY